MEHPESIIVDGIEYIRKDSIEPPTGNIRIVALQRGWIAVGHFTQESNDVRRLSRACIIRNWGTTKGLGQIALNGPTDKTVLDPCGIIEWNPLTEIFTMNCKESVWKEKLS